jgi:hypothetical protein
VSVSSSRLGTPTLVTTVAVALPLMFILGWSIGNQRASATPLSPDSVSSWVSALATLAIAILTFILAKETWYLRLAQATSWQN